MFCWFFRAWYLHEWYFWIRFHLWVRLFFLFTGGGWAVMSLFFSIFSGFSGLESGDFLMMAFYRSHLPSLGFLFLLFLIFFFSKPSFAFSPQYTSNGQLAILLILMYFRGFVAVIKYFSLILARIHREIARIVLGMILLIGFLSILVGIWFMVVCSWDMKQIKCVMIFEWVDDVIEIDGLAWEMLCSYPDCQQMPTNTFFELFAGLPLLLV